MATNADPGGGQQANNSRVSNNFGILVGWAHVPFMKDGIQLKLQSTIGANRENAGIVSHRYMMTRNQALILAKSLLDATGQTLPEMQREGRLKRVFRRLTGG